MFATHNTIIRLVSSEVSKDFCKAWEDLGLTTSTFTSDDKTATLLVGFGADGDVAKATELIPPEPKAKPKASGGKS